ncbi:MAG: hypothetical protein JXA91_00385 [Candidatus Thermoplasmatota archaeon]|nr:hypothetical protein [Candidatus Thermoplasmatota archaeon]
MRRKSNWQILVVMALLVSLSFGTIYTVKSSNEFYQQISPENKLFDNNLLINPIIYPYSIPATLNDKSNFQIDNDKIIYNVATDVLQVSDGYILTGYTGFLDFGYNLDYYFELVLIKTDFEGNKLWERTFQYPNSKWTSGISIHKTSDGGFAVGGYIVYELGYNALLLKTDKNGNTEWYKTYDADDAFLCCSMKQTKDNGYILSGLGIKSINDDESLIVTVLLKIDEQGNEEWRRNFDFFNYTMGYDVHQTSDEGFILTGQGSEGGLKTPMKGFMILMKTDKNGNEEWHKTYNYHELSNGLSVKQTNDDGFIITGYSYDTDQYTAPDKQMLLLLKTDCLGKEEWVKFFNFNDSGCGSSLLICLDSGFIIAGDSDSKGLILKTDENGNEEWRRIFQGLGNAGFTKLKETSDKGYILTGATYSTPEQGYPKLLMYLVKTSASGHEEWSKIFPEIGEESEISITIKKDSIIIGNIGENTLYDVNAAIKITGGFLNKINKNIVSSISTVPSGETSTIDMPKLFGFGRIEIAVIAYASNAPMVSKSANGLQFFSWTFLS